MKHMKSTYITVPEAVALLGGTIGRDTLYRAFHRGEAPGRQIGKRVLLNRAWVESGLISTDGDTA